MALTPKYYPRPRKCATHERQRPLKGAVWTRAALDVTDAERTAAYEAAWRKGALAFLRGTFGDLLSNEQANETAADFVRSTREDVDEIEADPAATLEWTRPVQEVANRTLFPKAASWYTGANIPGKPRLCLPYVGGCDVYRRKCDEVAASQHRGFELTARQPAAV